AADDLLHALAVEPILPLLSHGKTEGIAVAHDRAAIHGDRHLAVVAMALATVALIDGRVVTVGMARSKNVTKLVGGEVRVGPYPPRSHHDAIAAVRASRGPRGEAAEAGEPGLAADVVGVLAGKEHRRVARVVFDRPEALPETAELAEHVRRRAAVGVGCVPGIVGRRVQGDARDRQRDSELPEVQ